jgi:dTDP-4-dehydrorhamnose reductase
MHNIVILGTGFIGSNLSTFLEKSKHKITAFSQADLNYTNPDLLTVALKQLQCNILINCSGYTGSPNVDACEKNKEKCFFYNATLPLNLARVCEKLSIKLVNVSSGCIYTGYEKMFTEKDIPNFGIFNSTSSFYSQTKHICELNLADFDALTLRVRMPFNSRFVPKNLIYKIYKYDNIIDYPNSGTNTDNFNEFVYQLVNNPAVSNIRGPLNVINPGPITGKKVAELLTKYGVVNPNWKVVDVSELNIVAQRSNCILDDSRLVAEGLGLPHIDKILEPTIAEFAKNLNK